MDINASLSVVATTATQAWDTIASAAQCAGRTITQLATDVTPHASSGTAFIANKAQLLWTAVLPYLDATAAFFQSNVGVAITLLAVSLGFMKGAEQTENRIAKHALIALGILSAVGSGALLAGAHVLPTTLPFINGMMTA